jgi:hypothetical protein
MRLAPHSSPPMLRDCVQSPGLAVAWDRGAAKVEIILFCLRLSAKVGLHFFALRLRAQSISSLPSSILLSLSSFCLAAILPRPAPSPRLVRRDECLR